MREQKTSKRKGAKIMLTTTKSVTLKGFSVINGVNVEGYSAEINSDNPEDITISSWQQDKALYKANRSQCRLDQAEFEDAAYEIQDAMLAEKAAEKTVE